MIRMIIQTIGAFFSVFTLSVIFGVPKKYLVYSSLTGAAGWCVYLVLSDLGWKEFLAMFGATILVALMSNIFARVLKSPVSIYLIPGILPLVPGLGMYRTVYYIMQEENAMAGYWFTNTMQIAGMIALAIFFVDTLFRTVRKK
ncbi:MAG: threonine/serine exporter family protein [Lachnospiraceae bacterium]|nr:threonine/serine exporter family protein [Lachnospiraceae bacterium]